MMTYSAFAVDAPYRHIQAAAAQIQRFIGVPFPSGFEVDWLGHCNINSLAPAMWSQETILRDLRLATPCDLNPAS
jgi:hypothetical protein